MACSSIRSASSSSHTKNFDVFVSFRGTDTRNGFISHLFAALQRKGVVTFRDDQKIRKGELLEPELMEAIEGSRVFIVVFSKNYASSTWCMKELVKIVDWVEETGRSVIPIFYDVTPSEVRKQSGKFEKAFAKYEERFKDDLDMIQTWRTTLKSITDRCGWDMQNKSQHEEIEKIVVEVINLLGHNQILTFGDNLVDMDFRVKQLEELLDLDANDVVRVVGICGMGGIGKTTLAIALFNKISQQYGACCFIHDVSKNYENFGPTGVQKQLLCQVLKLKNIEIHNLYQGITLVRTRLSHLKALIILDNVDRVEQLEKFALRPRYLGAGSRIIIISRDERILRKYGVDKVYDVQLLNMDKSLQLFCKNAFKSDVVVKECEELTYDALDYAGGLPLAIEVLGSFLFDRDIYEWRNEMAKLKENPNKDIMDVLRISFDELEKNEKEIFLDIACFSFNELPEVGAKKFLSIHGFYVDIGLKILSEKSLISYTSYNGWVSIHMHDLLKELGRSIVQEKYPKEPRKWSRLWDFKDFYKVVMGNKEAKILEAMIINTHDKSELLEETMKVDAPTKMNHLKLLILKNVNLSGILNYHYNELRYLSWEGYPYSSLSSTFHPKQLVELNLRGSNIKQLWKGRKCLPNLRVLLLSYSRNLLEIPDLRGVPHLEKLDLQGCVEIMRIDPSIAILKELTILNLKNCKNLLLDLNIIFGLNSLKKLNLSGCLKLLNSHLLKKPRETEYLEKADENASVIQLSTSSVYEMLKLPFYFFSSRKYEDSLGLLVPYLSGFPCLFILDLSFCNLFKVPDAIGSLHSLESLNLGGNKFVTLPTTIKELSKLRCLNLEHCKQLKYLPELPTTKEKTTDEYFGGLYVFNCPNLSEMEHCYRMIFSWMIQIFKVYWQSSLSFRRLVIVIPGAQIPRWFSIQNVGHSIRMDLSPVIEDENWIGVACCALLVAHDEPTNFGQRWANYNRLNDYGSIGFSFQNFPGTYTLFPIHLKNNLVTSELDHLFIWFVSREGFLHWPWDYVDKRYDLDTRKFTASIFDHPKGLDLVAKSCGYRWVFKDDVEQLNPDTMFRGYSSSGKHKLLPSD